MDCDKNAIVHILIENGNKLLNQPYEKVNFTGDSSADDFLNDIEKFPHAFVLACIMDRQIKAEKAWMIPYKISNEINDFDLSALLQIEANSFKEMFERYRFHRFNNIMAKNFYLAIQKIHKDYNDNASNIWNDKPRSAAVVKKFLQFDGVGVKIATMATNILVREFKIPMEDYLCIDISPDVHVKRVFKRLGLMSENANNDELIYSARELNPEYLGIFDLACWEIGRKWCKSREADCQNCYLDDFCPKCV